MMHFDDILNNFLNTEYRTDKLRLPVELDTVYKRMVEKLKKDYPELAAGSVKLEDESALSIARQFHRYFPAHYFKAYHSLLSTEIEQISHNHDPLILHWPSLTVVDIGCGSGAVSLAILTLLLKFQQYLSRTGHSLSPVKVLLIGLDPNENMRRLYNEFVGSVAQLLIDHLIEIRHTTIDVAFPSRDIHRVTQKFVTPNHRHYVLFALSNVVLPLHNRFEYGSSKWTELIGQVVQAEEHKPVAFGMAEARAISHFVNRWKLDQIGILGIATNNSDKKGIKLSDKLLELTQQITESCYLDRLHSYTPGRVSIQIENPSASWWKSIEHQSSVSIHYHVAYAHLVSHDYASDQRWRDVLEYSNLELAWVRTRQYCLREALTDETELAVFDFDVELKLRRLRSHMLIRDWDALNTRYLLEFDTPKSETKARPKTIARIEEQILAVAIIQVFGFNIERNYSYSYQLKKDSCEYLYEYWLKAWKEFVRDTQYQAVGKMVVRADITEFYKNLLQDDLQKMITSRLSIDGNTAQLIEQLIVRNCGEKHEEGHGIPQGHIASGFWADVYLSALDTMIEQEMPEVKFRRYADDMVFAFDDTDEKTIVVQDNLQCFLDELKLPLSQEKNFTQSGLEYIEDTELDSELEALADKDLIPTINLEIFRFDLEHWQLYEQSQIEFLIAYRSALKALSINASIPWLKRKLHQYNRRRGRLNWPEASKLFTDRDAWLNEFKCKNSEWLAKLDNLRTRLLNLFYDSYNALENAKPTTKEYKTALRRFKFVSYRFAMLGITEGTEVITNELIAHPWRLSPSLACNTIQNAGQPELLIRVIRDSEYPYIRAVATRCLANIDYSVTATVASDAEELMWQITQDTSRHVCERLKASEGLIKLAIYQKVEFEQCKQLLLKEQDPYLAKNYMLLLCKLNSEKGIHAINTLASKPQSQMLCDVIQYIMRKREAQFDMENEPDFVQKYYRGYYPDTEVADQATAESSWN